MSQVQKTFRAIDVGDGSDGRWAAHLRTLFPQAEGWLTDEGRTAEGALRARRLAEAHMPELVPLLERLAQQVGRAGAGTFLTMAALKPFFSGCTQAGGNGRLVRDDDFAPGRMRSCHRPLRLPAPGHRHAGSRLGAGRQKIPVMIPWNVTLVDAGRAVTVYLGPGIELTEAPDACAANRRHLPVPEEDERTTRTRQRLAAIRAAGGGRLSDAAPAPV